MSHVRVAVVTPYHREPEDYLRRCLQSVAAQSHPCTHYMVSDGFPSPMVDASAARHIQLGCEHGDYGNTPRAVGSLLARTEGADAIVYLDADNYFLPDHVAALVAAWEQHGRSFDVMSTERCFIRPDGSLLPMREPLTPLQHCDTNCLFLANRALALTELWATMPPHFHAFGDRVLWNALRARQLHIGHLARQSVAYTTRWAAHYAALGEPLPADARDITPKLQDAAAWWQVLDEAKRARYNQLLGYDPGPALAAL